MNWPLWGGLLAMLLLAKHTWVLFAPVEHAVPGTTVATQSAQAEQLFGTVDTSSSSASLSGVRPIGIFAHRDAGFAVMLTERGQIGVALGREVLPGIVLVETHADYVVLEQHGIRHRVELGEAPETSSDLTPVWTDPTAAADQQMLNRLPPEQREIVLRKRQETMRGRP